MDAPSNSSVSKGQTEEVNNSTLTRETNWVQEEEEQQQQHHHEYDASSPTTSITAFTSEDKHNPTELSSKNDGLSM